MKKTKRSLFVAFLLTVIGALLIGGATVAWFTDQDSNTGNSFASGTLDISLNKSGSTDNYFNVTDIYPGATDSTTLIVSNIGSLPLDYTFDLEKTNALFEGDNPLQITLTDEDGNVVENLTASRRLLSGEAKTFTVSYLMPTAAGNSYQNQIGTLNIIVNAEQINQ